MTKKEKYNNCVNQLTEINSTLKKKAISMITNKMHLDIWNFNHINNILIFDKDIAEGRKIKYIMEHIFHDHPYSFKTYISNTINQFENINLRYYITFIDYSLCISQDINKIFKGLLNQHVVVIMCKDEDQTKEMKEQYPTCLYIQKPANFKKIRSIVDFINNNTVAKIS